LITLADDHLQLAYSLHLIKNISSAPITDCRPRR